METILLPGFAPLASDVGGRTVRAYVAGEGPPIVLVHGLGGAAVNWVHLAPLLASRHRVVVVDLPGHGRSEPLAPGPATLARYAAAVAEAAERADAARAAYVGHSWAARSRCDSRWRVPTPSTRSSSPPRPASRRPPGARGSGSASRGRSASGRSRGRTASGSWRARSCARWRSGPRRRSGWHRPAGGASVPRGCGARDGPGDGDDRDVRRAGARVARRARRAGARALGRAGLVPAGRRRVRVGPAASRAAPRGAGRRAPGDRRGAGCVRGADRDVPRRAGARPA
ncbi:MAG: alpha/beta fold hydrolase [Thermoleophilia bacterium]